jgi:hypothetical protein
MRTVLKDVWTPDSHNINQPNQSSPSRTIAPPEPNVTPTGLGVGIDKDIEIFLKKIEEDSQSDVDQYRSKLMGVQVVNNVAFSATGPSSGRFKLQKKTEVSSHSTDLKLVLRPIFEQVYQEGDDAKEELHAWIGSWAGNHIRSIELVAQGILKDLKTGKLFFTWDSHPLDASGSSPSIIIRSERTREYRCGHPLPDCKRYASGWRRRQQLQAHLTTYYCGKTTSPWICHIW